jgi:hypothetical protein
MRAEIPSIQLIAEQKTIKYLFCDKNFYLADEMQQLHFEL